MKISDKEVRYISDLANLKLSDVERAGMERDLNAILGYVDQLSELDTRNLDPMAQVAQIAELKRDPLDVLRPDEARECLPREAALANAPQSDGTFFRVPKVIER
jgi:aspartyl-tRNA(Asn)/glutamyl-tRNA(Gln) amidotransferase subunit C